MKKRTKYIIASIGIVWIILAIHTIYKVVDERKPKDESPYIYHLVNDEYTKVFVYPTFKDEYQYIKYLFDFANKQDGNLMFVYREDDIYIGDKILDFNKKNRDNPYFYFIKEDSTKIYYNSITILINASQINFEKLPISNSNDIGLKLKSESDSLDRNIMQNFVSCGTYDLKAENANETYIYELYSKSDSLWARKIFHDYGKYFSIDVY